MEVILPHDPGWEAGHLLAGQNQVLEMIALGAPIVEILDALVRVIDGLFPRAACSILMVDVAGGFLRPVAAPRMSEAYHRRPVPILAAEACGAAVHGRQQVIVEDIATHPLAGEFRKDLLQHGFHAYWLTPILSSSGNVLGIFAVYHYENRKLLENETRVVAMAAHLARIIIESQATHENAAAEHFRSLIEAASHLILVLNPDGAIRYASPSVERILGYRQNELCGRYATEAIHRSDQEEARAACAAASLSTDSQPTRQFRVQHKNRSWVVLEVQARNLLSDTAVAGIVVTASDVTDRHRAEEALVASEERYRELFENAYDMLYTHDLGGRITSVNRAGEQITGFTREEILRMQISDLAAPEHKTIPAHMMERKIGGEPVTSYNLELLTKDGMRVPVEIISRLIFRKGAPVAVQGIARNVTERKNLESQLLHSQKMEAIGRLAGGIAHDFNNLLTVITGYTQWMLDDIPPGAPIRENAAEILLAAHRASALTNQLLAFSRNQVIQPTTVDLNEQVAAIDQMLRRVIGEHIELVTSMAPNLELVKADPGQMQQVILNLVLNARDAMPKGGKLLIETANVVIG
ncbi:MAG: PAS domain S-box protein, partial [Bryobacteraceae bacterium]